MRKTIKKDHTKNKVDHPLKTPTNQRTCLKYIHHTTKTINGVVHDMTETIEIIPREGDMITTDIKILVGVGKIISAIVSITSGIENIMTHIGALSGMKTAFSTIGLLLTIGGIMAVLTVIVSIVKIIKHMGEISKWFRQAWSGVFDCVKTIRKEIGDFFNFL